MIIQWYRSWCYLPRQTYPYELVERVRSYNLIDRSFTVKEELRGVLKPMDTTVFVEGGENYKERVWVFEPFEYMQPDKHVEPHYIGPIDAVSVEDAKAVVQAMYLLTKE